MSGITHKQTRPFQPQKLSLPRHFELSDIIAQAENTGSPLNIEIGAGKGKHAMMFAKTHPDEYLIAIERTRNKFEAFSKLIFEHRLDNLEAVHADAIPWLVHAIAPNSVNSTYILYPNPEQHNPNQQWLNMPFFEFLLSRLKVGGEIILATNIEGYSNHAEHQANNIWRLPTVRQEVSPDSQRTHFEIKYLARGETCWQLNMTKPEGYQTRFDHWKA